MDPAIITAKLAIVQKDGHVFAELVYENPGDQTAFLLKVNAALGNRLENDLFKIETEKGAEVSYIGPLAKLGKPTIQDFLRMDPKDRAGTRVRLDDSYRFLADGPHDYKVVYSAYHQYPERTGFWELVSNEVKFTR